MLITYHSKMRQSNAKTFLCVTLLIGTLNFTFVWLNVAFVSHGSTFLRLFITENGVRTTDKYSDTEMKRLSKFILFTPVHKKPRLADRRKNEIKGQLIYKNHNGTIKEKTECRIFKQLKVIL